MADEVLTSPPKRPVPEIKPPAKPATKKTVGAEEQRFDGPTPFLPPKTSEEVVSTEVPQGPGLTVQRPGEEPAFEPAQQKIWDARSQSYVEPYKRPEAPTTEAPAQKFPSRAEFEDHAFSALGGNPFEIDPVRVVKEATADLRPLFNYVFGNEVYWGDRDRLNPEQAKFWEDTTKAYRAQIFNESTSNRATQIDVYNQMMSRFDNEQKEQQEADRRVATRSAAVLAATRERRLTEATEAREERAVRTEELKARTAALAEEREARLARASEWKQQQDIIKGLKTKEPSRADIQAIAKAEFTEFNAVDDKDNFIMELDETFGPDVYKNQLSEKTLESLNAAREAAGMPELHEIVTTMPDGNRYQYLEAPEAEFDKEVKKQYPNAVKYGEVYWVLLPSGQYRKITAGE